MMEIDQSSCTSVLSVDEEIDRDRYQTAVSTGICLDLLSDMDK
jgi:hypothetical protein